MSNIKEQIRQEIERLKGICTAQIKANPGQTFPFVMEMTGYDKLLSFIDSLPDEKPSEDLEEAAESYEEEQLSDYGYRGEWSGAFIAGANWQKEQMLKDAVEGEVIYDLGGFFRIKSEAIDGAKYKVGSWVKLIIVKED